MLPWLVRCRSRLLALENQAIFRAIVLAVVFLAFAIRLYRLGAVGIEYDEAFSIRTAAGSLQQILFTVATYEPHPPLYYSFLHFWYPIAGATEFALRFPTVAANVVTIVLLIKIADLLEWREAGLIGAFLLALNPYQVWYAQEARMYTPVACFGAGAVYGALRILRRGNRRDLAIQAIFTILALYSHYYAIFLVVFLNLQAGAWMLMDRGARRRVRRWLEAQAVTAACYIPWLAYANRISLYYTRPPVSLSDMAGIAAEALRDFSVGTSLPMSLAVPCSLAFLAVLVIGIWAAWHPPGRKQSWRGLGVAAGYLLHAPFLGAVVSIVRSMYQPRYFLVGAPAFFLVLGLGLARLRRWSRPAGAAVGAIVIASQLASLAGYFTDPRYDKSEVGRAIMEVGKHAVPGDAVILAGWSQKDEFWYYHDLRGIEPAPGYVLPLSGPRGWSLTLPAIDQIMRQHRGAWLLTYSVLEVDGRHLIETYLARNYYQVIAQRVINNYLFYYTAAPPTAPHVVRLEDSCNGEVMLEDFEYHAVAARAGEVLPLALRWRALARTPRDYVVSWRLRDSEGHVVLQRDSPPASGFAPTSDWQPGQEVVDRYGMLLPAYLPPGRYTLEIVVFDRTSGAVCTFEHDGQPVPGTALSLAGVTVLDGPPAPAIDDPRPDYPLDLALGSLALVGYDLDPGPYHPGDQVALRLYWRVPHPVPGDVTVTARLLDEQGKVLNDLTEPLGSAAFPTSRWQSGRALATYVDLPIPARSPSGTYQIALELKGGGISDRRVDISSPVAVVGRPHDFTVPPVPHPLRATFGGAIDLLGYGIQPEATGTLAPGGQIELTLFWRAVAVINEDYKVFTHLVGPDGKIYGQDDSVPLDGAAPTTSWIPGEVVRDRYTLSIPPSAPAGRYTLTIGFYEPLSGRRLPLVGRHADSLAIASLKVVG